MIFQLNRLIPSLTIRAFDHFLLSADRDCRDDEEECDKTHSGFFGEVRNRSAFGAASHFLHFLRSPSDKFRADDKKHNIFILLYLNLIR